MTYLHLAYSYFLYPVSVISAKMSYDSSCFDTDASTYYSVECFASLDTKLNLNSKNPAAFAAFVFKHYMYQSEY